LKKLYGVSLEEALKGKVSRIGRLSHIKPSQSDDDEDEDEDRWWTEKILKASQGNDKGFHVQWCNQVLWPVYLEHKRDPQGFEETLVIDTNTMNEDLLNEGVEPYIPQPQLIKAMLKKMGVKRGFDDVWRNMAKKIQKHVQKVGMNNRRATLDKHDHGDDDDDDDFDDDRSHVSTKSSRSNNSSGSHRSRSSGKKKKKRCSKGYRKNRKTGECDKKISKRRSSDKKVSKRRSSGQRRSSGGKRSCSGGGGFKAYLKANYSEFKAMFKDASHDEIMDALKVAYKDEQNLRAAQ
jgi:hypothetical protein